MRGFLRVSRLIDDQGVAHPGPEEDDWAVIILIRLVLKKTHSCAPSSTILSTDREEVIMCP